MRIGELINTWRMMHVMHKDTGYGIRAVAKEIGISHGTLSRIERGESMDGDTMAKIMIWMFNSNERPKK